MRNIKKDLINNYYLEAPDQINIIKCKVDLKRRSRDRIVLNKNLKFATMLCLFVIVFTGIFTFNFLLNNNDDTERLSINQNFINETFRVKIKEENIKSIVKGILPLNSDDKAAFIQAFGELNLDHILIDPVLDGFEYISYNVNFKDKSEFHINVYSCDIIRIDIENDSYYFYEKDCYVFFN